MSQPIEIKVFSSPEETVEAFARELLSLTSESKKPRFDIALSGGNTPRLLFSLMEKKYSNLYPWGKMHFWWGDERCVAPTNADSNYKMANDYLISKVAIPPKNIHRIKGEDHPEDEAIRYSKLIADNLDSKNNWPVFDLITLGLGDDGHTASIFPNQMELLTDDRICKVAKHPVSGQKRVTLTGKVINNAVKVFFLVTGKNKAIRIKEIMNDEEVASQLPAYFIKPTEGEVVWFLDKDAGVLI